VSKADFTSIYSAPDPRAYYATLAELDYQIPDHGGRLFSQLADHLATERELDCVRVADLCCSYGVNAAVMKHGLSFAELADHYTSDKVAELDADTLVEFDREWYAANSAPLEMSVIGLDVSQPAVDYATEVGLLDAGAAEDLETADPSPRLAAELADVDLVTVTGGIGYITESTIGRVLEATPDHTWVAALSLRWIDFEPVAAEAERHGLVVERLEGETFPQRRFADEIERQHALEQLARFDEQITPGEAAGYHEAALYLLRPPSDAAVPVDSLVDV
jgi:hypothetical protein